MFLKEKMTMDKYIEKAFTSGDLANGGELQPEQASQFILGVIEKSVILPECRREPMTANKLQVDKLTYATDILQKPPAVGTAPTTTSKPTPSKITLSAEEAIMAIDIGYDALEDSIEGNAIFDTIMALTNKRVAFELDKLILNGNKAGSTGDFLEILDGVFKQITSNVVDASSATLSKTVLFNAMKAMPGKFMDVETDLRFYTSHLAKLDYVQSLAEIGVNEAFVRYLLEGKEPSFQGIPVRKVPAISTENIGGGSPAVYGSKGLLINPKNIIFGVHRDISYEMQRQPRKRIIEVTMTMKIDVKLEEETACVEIDNIKHST